MDKSCSPATPRAVALGNFDGVHVGHAELIRKMVSAAKKGGLIPSALIFDRHPENVLAGRPITPVITDNAIKTEILRSMGVELVEYLEFSPEIRSLGPDEFVDRLLIGQMNARLVVFGFHYRFSAGAAAGARELSALCESRGIEYIIVPPVLKNGVVVSSSHIRSLIALGDMQSASDFLGRPFTIDLPVVQGRRLGRTIGVPTINQVFPPEHIIPCYGVYATTAMVDGERRPAVTNVGSRPTVGGGGVNAETHIIGYDGSLYGRSVRIEFLARLRGEMRFPTLAALRAQILRDIENAAPYFEKSAPATE